MTTRNLGAEEFLKTWMIKKETDALDHGNEHWLDGPWYNSDLIEFAEAFAQGEAARVGELEAGLRAISKQAAWLLGHSFSIPWREGTSQILAEAEKLLRRPEVRHGS